MGELRVGLGIDWQIWAAGASEMLRGRALTDRAGSNVCAACRVELNRGNALPPTRKLLFVSFFVTARYRVLVAAGALQAGLQIVTAIERGRRTCAHVMPHAIRGRCGNRTASGDGLGQRRLTALLGYPLRRPCSIFETAGMKTNPPHPLPIQSTILEYTAYTTLRGRACKF